MGIREVSYERLFSFGQYENEKIRMSAEVEAGQNPDQVLASIVLKITSIEEVLQTYRRKVSHVEYLKEHIHDKERSIAELQQRISDMKVKIDEISALLEKGQLEVDDKLRHACDRESYKTLKENLVSAEKELASLQEEFKTAVADEDLLKKRITNGDFSVEGIKIVPPRRYHEY